MEDTSDEDYTVTTSAPVSTSSMIKLAMAGGFSVLVLLVMIGIFYFMSANSTPSPQAQQQQQRPPKDRMQADKDKMLSRASQHQTFSDRHDRIQAIENQNKDKPTTSNPPGQSASATAPATPPPTVTAPRVVYRSVPPTAYRPRYVPRRSNPQRTFQVQRPASVVATRPEPEIDDPNYGFFTAPPTTSQSTPTRSIQLTKSKQLTAKQSKRKGMVNIFKQPVQVASNSPTLPTPQPLELQSNLSGSLVNPYLNSPIARNPSARVVPADTVINAQIKTRVAWTPENPSLAMGREIRLVLNEDLKGRNGNVVARQGAMAVARVSQATDKGLISAAVVSIDGKPIPSGSIEVHKDGDQTMVADLNRKGGKNNSFLKAALDIGIGGVQTMTSNLNNPTSQTAITNGNQTFLSTNNNNRDNTAAFVEGATNRVGQMIRESATGPEQSAIGIYRLGGKVQLYVVREVRL